MPNTPANVTIVTAAYDKWQSRANQFANHVPGVTKADVDSAYDAMQKAIRQWEAPGPEETEKQAKKDRKDKRKSWWPKFKQESTLPEYKSKEDVRKRLTAARKNLKKLREAKPRDEAKIAAAVAQCNALLHVLDRWDALHS